MKVVAVYLPLRVASYGAAVQREIITQNGQEGGILVDM